MRAALTIAGAGLLVWCATLAWAEPPSPEVLAEMKKCAVCKELAANPTLMGEMTWETHKIDNGMLCVATVPKEHGKEFAALHEKMMTNVKQVQADQKAGKPVQLCAFCEGMAELQKAGATEQVIELENGAVSLLTSTEPEIVAKIHAQADKAIAEQKKAKEQSTRTKATSGTRP